MVEYVKQDIDQEKDICPSGCLQMSVGGNNSLVKRVTVAGGQAAGRNRALSSAEITSDLCAAPS